jgi:hypothetical protein
MLIYNFHRLFQLFFTPRINQEIGWTTNFPGGMAGQWFIDSHISYAAFAQFL